MPSTSSVPVMQTTRSFFSSASPSDAPIPSPQQVQAELSSGPTVGVFVPEWTYATLTADDVHDLVESLYGAKREEYSRYPAETVDDTIVQTYKHSLDTQLRASHPTWSRRERRAFEPRQDLTSAYFAATQAAELLCGTKGFFGTELTPVLWKSEVVLAGNSRNRPGYFGEAFDRWIKRWNGYELMQRMTGEGDGEGVFGSRVFVDWHESQRRSRY